LSRIEEVRASARGWNAAGAIDDATLSAIETAYPDPRLRLHGVWRVLIFVLVSVVVNALFFMLQPGSVLFAPSIAFGLLLAGATEGLRGSRYAGTGLDAASSFWAVIYLLVAVGDVLFRGSSHEETSITAMLAIVAAVSALAAFRWGFVVYAVCAAGAAYALLGRFPGARPFWIVASIAAIVFLSRRTDAATLAPDHRRGLAAAVAVSAAALYAAVNLYSLDHGFIEALATNGEGLQSMGQARAVAPPARLLAGLATAVYPVIFLAWGIRARRTLLLGVGLGATALSAATLRFYVHIGPLWEVLAVCGVILIAAAIAIQRALRGRPAGEWRGLTAEPLYDRERGGISPLGVLVAHAAGGAIPTTAPENGGLTTDGGRYGGGGASGTY
jgi:hypothetical protein